LAKHFLKLGERELEAEVQEGEGPTLQVSIGDRRYSASLTRLGDSPRYLLQLGDRITEVVARETAKGFLVHINGTDFEVETARPSRARQRREEDATDFMEDGRWVLQSPLTGSVVDIRVEAGSVVAAGDVLLVVEAMKMQNELRSRVAGRVAAVHVSQGQRVERGLRLIEIEADASSSE
jgi:biotin carboxyl carrier protein